jgi:oxygen-independent coproporphyrinogen III oxidase
MRTSFSTDLHRQMSDNAYPGYVYSYPHKKAYRPLDPPRELREVWAGEDRDHLFCYVHIPFCTQRCSFCNLFTYVPGEASPSETYVEALAREVDLVAEAIGRARFARLYVGGGTPTYLTTPELRRLVRSLRASLGVVPDRTEGCIECSPETIDAEKVEALRELGFRRVSLGVQSFREEELRQVNRRFDPRLHDEAIRLIGRANFAHFNIDLIYGLPGQTLATWRDSLARAVHGPATSLFLYPLYVRPLTGLGVRRMALDAPTTHEMAAMYDHARDRLARVGFRQASMRQFRRDRADEGGEYRCQQDGMLGLGAGARSYTRGLHYSTPWRMVARNIRAVVEDYETQMGAGDTRVSHGFALDDDERRRRAVIQSLLFDGLRLEDFADDPREVFAEEFDALLEEGLVALEPDSIRLTPLGTKHADIVGQLFFSDRVRALIAAFEYDV